MFPAYAGMNRSDAGVRLAAHSVPRLRGDEPHVGDAPHALLGCSPPTRG